MARQRKRKTNRCSASWDDLKIAAKVHLVSDEEHNIDTSEIEKVTSK